MNSHDTVAGIVFCIKTQINKEKRTTNQRKRKKEKGRKRRPQKLRTIIALSKVG
jgi:hypothetical protein